MPAPMMDHACTSVHFQNPHQFCICKKIPKSNTIPGSKHPFMNILCKTFFTPNPPNLPLDTCQNLSYTMHAHFQSSCQFGYIIPPKKQSPQRVNTYPQTPAEKKFPLKPSKYTPTHMLPPTIQHACTYAHNQSHQKFQLKK